MVFSHISRSFAVVAALALLIAGAGPLFSSGQGWETCRPDWKRLCKEANDQFAVFQCMERRKKNLNPTCREFFTEESGRLRAGARSACGDDYARLCWNVVPGNGRIFRCLQKQLDQLSPDCRAHFDSFPGLQ